MGMVWRCSQHTPDYGTNVVHTITSPVLSPSSPVPTAPLNLTSVNVGPFSISVSWEPPSSPNGVLLSYLVTYTRTDNNSLFALTTFTLTTPPNVMTANLTSLSAFVPYRITVRANTSVGFGPDSVPLTEMTLPFGECGHCQGWLECLMLCYIVSLWLCYHDDYCFNPLIVHFSTQPQ